MMHRKEATLNLKIDASGALAGANSFQTATGGIVRGAGNAKIAVAAMTAAVIAGMVKVSGMAGDMMEVQSKFNVVFQGLTREANAWSKNFGDAVGRSQMEIKRAMAGTQDLFVPLGFGRKEAFELSKALTELSVDVASFNNSMDADVMANFQSALVGNHETVRKFGIIISEAAIEQEAFRRGLNKSYKDLTDQQKVLLRYSLIVRGSSDAQGDAIRTADSYANQMKRLKAALADTGVELGEVFLPAATKALQGVNSLLKEGRTAVKDWAKDFEEGVALVTGSIEKLDDVSRKVNFETEFNRFGPDTQKSIREAYLSSHPQDKWAFTKQKVTDPMGGGREVFQRPRDTDYALKLMESYDRNLKRGYTPPSGPDLSSMLEQAGNDGASAYTGPGAQYPDPEGMERYWSTSIDYMNQDIETRKDAIAEMDRMEKSVERELDLIGRLPDSYERAAEAIEYAEKANALYGEGSEEAQRKIEAFDKSLKHLERNKKLVEMADQIGQAFSKTFTDLLMGAATAEDAFKSLGAAILDAVMQQMVVQPIAQAISGGLGGLMTGMFMHTGGTVGQTASPTRYVDPLLFASAPRLHTGLKSDEFPAILQRGETVTPKGQAPASAAPNVTFNIQNQSGAQVEAQQTGVQFDGRRMIVGMVLKDKRNNGPMARANRRR